MAKNAATATTPEAPAEVKEAAEVRVPADLRARLLKKFHGKFLPKGILRERFKAIMERWNSGPDHGNVTLEEIKAVLEDWKGTRAKPRVCPGPDQTALANPSTVLSVNLDDPGSK